MNEFFPSRRRFLGGFASHSFELTAAALVGATAAPPSWQRWWDTEGKEHMQERTRELEGRIRERYGIEVKTEFGESGSAEFGDGNRMWELQSDWLRYKSLEHLQKLLEPYPPELLRGRLREIYLIRHATGPGFGSARNIRGFAGDTPETQGKLWVIVPEDFFTSYFTVFGLALNRLVTHHETAHVLMNSVSEDEWEALHPNIERYPLGLWRTLDESHPPEGFITTYAASSPTEDIAEVAAALFATKGSRAELERRMRSDTILRRKVEFVRQWFERESGGRMNRQYWEDLENGRVDEGYWNTHSGA